VKGLVLAALLALSACKLPPDPVEPDCRGACRKYAHNYHVNVVAAWQWSAGNMCECLLDDRSTRLTCDASTGDCP
jgi:predicted lipoprotein